MAGLQDVATEDLVAELRRRTPTRDRADAILAVGQVISRIPKGPNGDFYSTPPPLIGFWATMLHDEFGVRVHAELATKEVVRVQSKAGNHGPTQVVTRNTPAPMSGGPDVQRMHDTRALFLEWLRSQPDHPELAVLADRAEAAEGDKVAQALIIAELKRDHPEAIAKGEEMLRAAAPGVFG